MASSTLLKGPIYPANHAVEAVLSSPPLPPRPCSSACLVSLHVGLSCVRLPALSPLPSPWVPVHDQIPLDNLGTPVGVQRSNAATKPLTHHPRGTDYHHTTLPPVPSLLSPCKGSCTSRRRSCLSPTAQRLTDRTILAAIASLGLLLRKPSSHAAAVVASRIAFPSRRRQGPRML
jgi:hypothetical protein